MRAFRAHSNDLQQQPIAAFLDSDEALESLPITKQMIHLKSFEMKLVL